MAAAGPATWRSLLAETRRRLGGDAPAARWLCEVASGSDHLEDIASEVPSERMVAHLDAMLARYEGGEPLAYVLGRWGFRHLDLAVDRRVLIPRPETEVVVDVALDLAGSLPGPITIADLGTGSGAIGLSLAHELPADGVTVWLTDASADALDVARANLAGIGRRAANVRIAEPGRWFDALPAGTVVDLAVANPPYVAAGSPLVDESVTTWEPHAALFAGPDGLDDIAVIVATAPASLRPGGWLVLEIGADQGDAVGELLRRGPYEAIGIRPDLAGRDRVAVARLGSPRASFQPSRTLD